MRGWTPSCESSDTTWAGLVASERDSPEPSLSRGMDPELARHLGPHDRGAGGRGARATEPGADAFQEHLGEDSCQTACWSGAISLDMRGELTRGQRPGVAGARPV